MVRKGIGEVMGGKVLELETERLRAEGQVVGKEIGKAEGEERLSILINHLILDGRNDEIQSVVTNAEIRRKLYKEYGMIPINLKFGERMEKAMGCRKRRPI